MCFARQALFPKYPGLPGRGDPPHCPYDLVEGEMRIEPNPLVQIVYGQRGLVADRASQKAAGSLDTAARDVTEP